MWHCLITSFKLNCANVLPDDIEVCGFFIVCYFNSPRLNSASVNSFPKQYHILWDLEDKWDRGTFVFQYVCNLKFWPHCQIVEIILLLPNLVPGFMRCLPWNIYQSQFIINSLVILLLHKVQSATAPYCTLQNSKGFLTWLQNKCNKFGNKFDYCICLF